MNPTSHSPDQAINIILVDDDRDVRENLVDLLSTQYQKILEFDSPKPALHQLQANDPAIILTDLRMPGGDGLEFAKEVQRIDQDIPVILMSGYGDITIAVEAMKHGVYDFIEKPVDTDRLLKSIQRAVDKRLLTLSLHETRQKLAQHNSIDAQILGHSPMIRQLKQDIVKLAPMDIPVLIYGETGSGKELVARCLHEFSPQSKKAFVALNCAAIPEHLAEAELFGYAKGAFTDASSSHVGKLEYANGGTLFLDEVESLSQAIQAKLLRVLQDGLLTPLGSNTEVRTSCRVISASKEELRNHKHFRQDLYFRLQVGECRIPNLQERKEDILMLFEYFTLQNCENFKIAPKPLTDTTQQALLRYHWPGNVREIINVSTRYVINDFKDIDQVLGLTSLQPKDNDPLSLKERVNAYEEKIIRSKLAEHKGNVALVLKDLKLERRTFNQKLSRFKITTADFKK